MRTYMREVSLERVRRMRAAERVDVRGAFSGPSLALDSMRASNEAMDLLRGALTEVQGRARRSEAVLRAAGTARARTQQQCELLESKLRDLYLKVLARVPPAAAASAAGSGSGSGTATGTASPIG